MRYILTMFLLKHGGGLVGVIWGKIIAHFLAVGWIGAVFCLKTAGAWPLRWSHAKKLLGAYFALPAFFAVAWATRMPDFSGIGAWMVQSTIYLFVAFPLFYFLVEKEIRIGMAERLKRFLAFGWLAHR